MPVTTRSRFRLSPSLYLTPDRISSISSWVDGAEGRLNPFLAVEIPHDPIVVRTSKPLGKRKRIALAPLPTNLARPNDGDANIDRGHQTKRRKMDDERDQKTDKRRGRPPGSKNKITQSLPVRHAPDEVTIQSTTSKVPTNFDGDSSKKKRKNPRSRSRSLSERAKSDSSIDMKYLASCRPRVRLMNDEQARLRGPLPPKVSDLLKLLNDGPSGSIPQEMQKAYSDAANTPRKHRNDFTDRHFLENHPYPLEHLSSLKKQVDRTVRIAMKDNLDGAHERQWGANTVVPLFRELETWTLGEKFRLLNVENCSIEPSEIRLERPNGEGKLNLDESSDTQSLNTQTATRMIDWALGLAFDEDSDDNENELIEMAFMKLGDYEASVNQSTSWIRSIPLFLDIEIKKKNSPINPEVQLAIWAAAGLNKKRRHGWDTSLPIPAIAINAHTWEFYIFFERGEDLIMMGPEYMGSTKTIKGTYDIVYRLYQLIVWGITVYRKWFEDEIITWCKKIAAGKS